MNKNDLQENVDQVIDQALNLYIEKENLLKKFNLKRFINQHISYEQVNVSDKQTSKKEIKKFLKTLVYKQLHQKEEALINKEQLNQFYRKVIISSMDNCWIDQVDLIAKIKINSQQWTKTGRPEELIHHQVAFESFESFLNKVTLSIFDNLLLSKIFTNEEGQLIVVFN